VQTHARIDIFPVPALVSHVGDVEIVVGEAGDLDAVNMFVRDIAEQFHHLPKTDVIRQVGNHRIELYRVIPVRFAYEPVIKPTVLEPQTLYVAPNDTYVVDDDTLIELIHKEHGQRHIWFRGGKYVLRIGRVSIHLLDAAERNRVALSRIRQNI
jgi:hypothetical protein